MKDKLRVYKLDGREIGEVEMLALAKAEDFDGDDMTSAYQHLKARGVEIRFVEYRDVALEPYKQQEAEPRKS